MEQWGEGMEAGSERQGVSFKILGSFEAWHRGQRLRVGGPIQERVLTILLLEANRVVPLSRLEEAAWNDAPPATSTHQIRKIIADLRRRIPDGAAVIRTDGPGYRVVVEDDQLDLSLFTLRIRRAREAAASGLRANAAEQLRAALDLWRGPLMTGGGGSLVETAAAMLEERRLSAAEQLIDLRLGLGEAADLIGDLRQLVREHPLREQLRAQLMLALYRSGRQAEALEEYGRVREVLAEEMGIDPGHELTSMHEGILRNSPDLAAPARPEEAPRVPRLPAGAPAAAPAASPCSLPYDLPDFAGRESELRALIKCAADGSQRGAKIMVIEGMGGSGKTTLAVHAAYQLAAQYPDGQLCIDLRGFTEGQKPLDPEVALEVLLRTLGVPGDQVPDSLLSRIALWRVTTAQRRLLVVLDNAINAAQVRPLLPSSPSCLVLVTSRARLSGIDGAEPFPIGLLSPQDSLDLLSQRLGAERVAAEPQAMLDLAQLCGHLPLALRISVGRLRNRPRWTVGYLVARLQVETRTLNELSMGDRSVAASLQLSYLAMDPWHQVAFRLLGLHPGSDVDEWTAAALLGVSADEAGELLEHLLDVHLLEQRELGRYAFHDLVRSFARSLRDEDTEAADGQAVVRLLDYYVLVADRASQVLHPGRAHIPVGVAPRGTDELPELADTDAAIAWFTRERVNLLEAVRLADQSGLHLHAACLPRSLGYYFQDNGYLSDGLEVEQIGLAAARVLEDPLLIRMALLNLSVALWQLCRFQEGVGYLEQALELAVESGDRRREAACLSRLGAFHNRTGHYTEGLRCLERALAMHRELVNPREEAATLISISSATTVLGRYAVALDTAHSALVIYQRLGEHGRQVLALVNEANARLGLGESATAFARLTQAHELSRRLHTPMNTALVLARLADAYQQEGRHADAYDYGLRALELCWTDRSPAHNATVENVVGRIHNSCGEPRLALEHHRLALLTASAIEFRIEVAGALQGMAAAEEALGDAGSAGTHREAADRLFDLMGVPVDRRRPC